MTARFSGFPCNEGILLAVRKFSHTRRWLVRWIVACLVFASMAPNGGLWQCAHAVQFLELPIQASASNAMPCGMTTAQMRGHSDMPCCRARSARVLSRSSQQISHDPAPCHPNWTQLTTLAAGIVHSAKTGCLFFSASANSYVTDQWQCSRSFQSLAFLPRPPPDVGVSSYLSCIPSLRAPPAA